MAEATTDRLLLSAKEAAQLLGVSRSSFYSLLSSGRIGPVGIRFGRSVRWSVEEIRAWILAKDHRTGSLPNRDKWLALQGTPE